MLSSGLHIQRGRRAFEGQREKEISRRSFSAQPSDLISRVVSSQSQRVSECTCAVRLFDRGSGGTVHPSVRLPAASQLRSTRPAAERRPQTDPTATLTEARRGSSAHFSGVQRQVQCDVMHAVESW